MIGATRAEPRWRGTPSRRSALSFLAGAPPSDAKLELIYDGELQTAYTFPVQLQVIALRGSVATQWEGEFNKTMVGKGKAAVTTAPSPGEMFDELTRTAPPGGYLSPADFIAGRTSSPTIAAPSKKDKKKSKGAPKFAKADVVSVGDEFLAAAVTQGLVLPLDTSVAYNEWYARLPYVWRELGTRDPRTGLPAQPLRPVSNGGTYTNTTVNIASNNVNPAMYGVPYRWGCTLIAYRKDKLPSSLRDTPPRDWDDLWRPEFARRVGMGSGPRAMLTAALRAEGMSANSDGWGTDGHVRARLESLRRDQLLIQNDIEYLQALGNGDAWIAVGASDDVLSMARKSSLIGVVVPVVGDDAVRGRVVRARERGEETGRREPVTEPVVRLHHPAGSGEFASRVEGRRGAHRVRRDWNRLRVHRDERTSGRVHRLRRHRGHERDAKPGGQD
jgi:hypothetical protein